MSDKSKFKRGWEMADDMSLGCFTTFILLALAVGVYTSIKKAPSDGFLFDTLFLGGPVLLLVSIGIGVACNRFEKVHRLCVLLVVGTIALSIAIPLIGFLWEQAKSLF
jgi:hypothetical protein